MKLYRNLCVAVTDCLREIFEEKKYADKAIEKLLKSNPKWGGRDRRFIAETSYDIVRWHRLYVEVAECAAHDYWSLLGVWCVLRSIPLPDWSVFEKMNEKKIASRLSGVSAVRKIRESVPDWLDTLGESELKEKWEEEIHAMNEPGCVVLRANTLKTSRAELQQRLKADDIPTTYFPDCPDALGLQERQNIFTHPLFKEGWFEMQDAGSQLISPFAQPIPGQRVIDACAGAGGKTLHLAALMENKGKIIALDTEEYKLEELKKRARRGGAFNIETRVVESSKTIKRLANTADCLLLDVPCSGSGVLRRNPDAKWKLTLPFIEQIKNIQQQILQDYSVMVKDGGWLIYSTCSIFPSENRKQVDVFLKNNSDFELDTDRQLFPSQGWDGFYMARLKRKSMSIIP